MLDLQPLQIDDFSGGITDNFLDNALNKYKEADNFFITLSKKLYTRYGSTIYNPDSTVIPLGNYRISSLVIFKDHVLQFANKEAWYFNPNYTQVSAPNEIFPGANNSSYISNSEWNEHLYATSDDLTSSVVKIISDGMGGLKAFNAGLPLFASTPTVLGTAGANNYLYAFHYSYTYTIDGVTFQEDAPVLFYTAQNINAPDVNPVSISSIPVLSNGVLNNWDTANVKIKIYRSVNAGDTPYLIGTINNGVTTFNDNFSDASIQLNEALYIVGNGVVLPQHNPPPKCKFLHITGSTGYYAYIDYNGEILKNAYAQSIIGSPHAVPDEFVTELDDEITGINSYADVPIIFCKKSIHRVESQFQADGSGGSQTQKISNVIGCVSNNSIVKTPEGLFFAAQDGFYYTDGYKYFKISTEINKRYASLVENESQGKKIYGTYDSINRRILWSVQTNSGLSQDCDKIYVLDLNFGIKPDMPFTTYSGESFRPTAIIFEKNDLLRADKEGFLFKHNSLQTTDPKIDIANPYSTWGFETVIFNYESNSTSFGTNFVRKWVTLLTLMAANETNINIQVISNNDEGRKIDNLSIIAVKGNLTWGDYDAIWGDANLIWNYKGLINHKRHFPASSLRCSTKQIIITNGYSHVVGSSEIGQCIVDNTLKTVTLVDTTKAFPYYSEGYDIIIDGQVATFKIIDRISDTVVEVEDINNALIPGTFDFDIKGYKKTEILNLLNYVIHYAPLGKTQEAATK